jgi:serine/threonine-protein kinase
MSPEQWSGEPLDVRSDLYAVGVILYEMLTGRLPFEAATPMAMVRKHLTERPSSPSAAGRTVSHDLESLVMRALSASPKERHSSAEEMRADLLACVLAPEQRVESQAPAEAPRTMVLERAAAPRRPGTGGGQQPRQAPGTPPPRREPAPGVTARPATPRPAATPALRHEEDDVGEVEPPVAPPPRRRAALVVAGVTLAGLAAAAITLAVILRSGEARRPPPEVAAGPVVGAGPGSVPEAGPGPASPTGPIATSDVAEAPKPLPPQAIQAPAPAREERSLSLSRAPERKTVAPARPQPKPVAPPASPPAASSRAIVVAVQDSLNAIPTPPAVSGDGVISVQVEPFGEVFLDGKPYGEAPREFRVSAGACVLRATHPQLGTREKRVQVRPGERVRWVADFAIER